MADGVNRSLVGRVEKYNHDPIEYSTMSAQHLFLIHLAQALALIQQMQGKCAILDLQTGASWPMSSWLGACLLAIVPSVNHLDLDVRLQRFHLYFHFQHGTVTFILSFPSSDVYK